MFRDGVRKDLVGDLESGRCDNLLIYPNFIETEMELNSAIRTVDAVFIDGCHYPVQSGIVCKALHFGKWILSSRGDSWTNDVIAESGAGFTYPTRDADLIRRWEEWQSDDGEDRSRDYSKRLRDRSTVTGCFDEIAARLLNGDIFES